MKKYFCPTVDIVPLHTVADILTTSGEGEFLSWNQGLSVDLETLK